MKSGDQESATLPPRGRAGAGAKTQRAWALYDWANSAYNLVITSTIFPAYYESMTGDGVEGTTDYVTFLGRSFPNTSLYDYALAFSFLIVAALSPLLSSIADGRGVKKGFLRAFCLIGSAACAGLFFYGKDNLGWGLLCTVIACVGFWGSLVFYNSYLPEIAAPQEQDRVSARGFQYGYIGSVLLQIVCFVFVMKNDLFGITKGFASQLSFLLVGVWWAGFAQLALRGLPKGRPLAGVGTGLGAGYSALRSVWKNLGPQQKTKRFLLSFFFYSMGVQTVMLAATLYGKSELGIPTENLIIAILIIQVIAIAGAWAIAKLSARIGNLPAICVCVAVWIGICVAGYLLPARNPMAFYALAAVVGFVMGGIQSLSRSTWAKLMPPTGATASYFSFFDVTEKIGIVIGMASFGAIQHATGSQRTSVLALMVFFVVGLLLLIRAHRTRSASVPSPVPL